MFIVKNGAFRLESHKGKGERRFGALQYCSENVKRRRMSRSSVPLPPVLGKVIFGGSFCSDDWHQCT